MNVSGFQSLKITREGKVAEVRLVGPGKGNAMGAAFWREMPIAFAELDADADVRAIVLRGEGNRFSVGLDLMGMGAELAELLMVGPRLAADRVRLFETIRRMQQATACVAACRKPVIAAIHGHCIGGGIDLVTTCDVRLASADAIFSVREVKLAIVADVGTLQRLPTIVGQGHARELALTGDDIDAARAEKIGLVSRVYATADELFTEARAMAERIAANPPLAVYGTKAVMEEGVRRAVDDGLRHAALFNAAFLPSEDLGEAIGAFAARRPPDFKGR
jgi:enoyl-CoA hydratase